MTPPVQVGNPSEEPTESTPRPEPGPVPPQTYASHVFVPGNATAAKRQHPAIAKIKFAAKHTYKLIASMNKAIVKGTKITTRLVGRYVIPQSVSALYTRYVRSNPNMQRLMLKQGVIFFSGMTSVVMSIGAKLSTSSTPSLVNSVAKKILIGFTAILLLRETYKLTIHLRSLLSLYKTYRSCQKNPSALSNEERQLLTEQLKPLNFLKKSAQALGCLFGVLSKIIDLIRVFVPVLATAMLMMYLMESLTKSIFELLTLVSMLKDPNVSKEDKLTQFALLALNVLVTVILLTQSVMSICAPQVYVATTLLFALVKVAYIILSTVVLKQQLQKTSQRTLVDQSPQTVDQSPQTVDQSPQTVDQSPQTVDQSPQTVDQSPKIARPTKARTRRASI